MKQITRITPDTIRVRLVHQSLGTDGPLGALIIQEHQLNEYEFRTLQLEVARGEWEGYSISYVGKQDGKEIAGQFRENGTITEHLDLLGLANSIAVDMFQERNPVED